LLIGLNIPPAILQKMVHRYAGPDRMISYSNFISVMALIMKTLGEYSHLYFIYLFTIHKTTDALMVGFSTRHLSYTSRKSVNSNCADIITEKATRIEEINSFEYLKK
jgi:hypothetical protein